MLFFLQQGSNFFKFQATCEFTGLKQTQGRKAQFKNGIMLSNEEKDYNKDI